MAKRMATQMELFEPVERGFNEGGLMDEGGMVDAESGNEVPPGSLREEVRDDIPAQLSEGEFVFPADVVRYIGLENLMRMRQEAKQGLSQMEAMGQMGNSEEAVVQDDLPFDMYDLDIDDEGEYNSETRNYQVGGYVPPSVPQQPYNQPTQVDPRTGTYTLPGTGIAGYQVPSGGQTGYTPYGGAAPYFQPVQFTGPQFQTALQTTNLPTFAETVGSKPGQYDELRTYQNDAGQTLQIPFKDGKPIYPIPEGYKPIGEQPKPEEEQTTVTPTLGQTTVRDEGGGDGPGNAGLDAPSRTAVDAIMGTLSEEYADLADQNTINSLLDLAKPFALAQQVMTDFKKAQVKAQVVKDLAKTKTVALDPRFKSMEEQVRAEIDKGIDEVNNGLKGLTKEQKEQFKEYMEQEQEYAKTLKSIAEMEAARDSEDPDTGRTGAETEAGAGGYKGGPTGFEGGQAPGPSDSGISDDPDPDTGMTEAEAGAGAGQSGGGGGGSSGSGGGGGFAGEGYR